MSALTLGEIVRLTGGRLGIFDAPCPECGPGRRSPANRKRPVLRIWRHEPGFATYHCERCQISGYARDVSASDMGREFWAKARAEIETRNREAKARRSASAVSIFNEANALLPDTPGARFLINRGIDVNALPDLNHTLRWQPFCPWEDGRHGCMVGLFTDATTSTPKAIHRTAITDQGLKVDRKTLGPIAGSVIRFWPDEDVLDGLVLGEGIETVLSAATRIEHRGTLLQPAWAAGDANNIEVLPVLGGIEALTLLVDNDESGRGQEAAERCSQRWTAAGREVIRLLPRQIGGDFNNIIKVP